MKLDLLYEIDATEPWEGPHPQGQRMRERRAYREAIEQIKLADSLGYHTVWLVEHHFREGRSHCPAPEVVLGALSQVTRNIRLGFGVTLMPFGFTHPARIAEKVATLDVLSEGRAEWGTGRSTPMEQTAFHVDKVRSRDEWREAIEIVCGMWREQRFSWDSENFQFPERNVTPKPWQDPHPPPWMAATSPVTDVVNHRVAAYTLVHCADSLQQCEDNGIWDSLGWWYRHLAQFTVDWELPHLSPEEQEATFPLLKPLIEGHVPVQDFSDADMIVVGDPERCFEKMKHYADLGVDQLLCYVQFGQLSHESVMNTIEMIGKEVLPEIERYKPAAG
jgi:alkanesulfonate monooxygenase SsuD/methylene tetrahydromethanopterin reductase-like flavin-dependent oxidoreductase (luciferase family)